MSTKMIYLAKSMAFSTDMQKIFGILKIYFFHGGHL
nr:MAG TPA: hypothetical protein [Caudoviricetes sp.]